MALLRIGDTAEETMTPELAKEAARFLLSARGDHRKIDAIPPSCRPKDVEEGYAIQDALVSEWGLEVGGWKVGATNREWQAKVGVKEPMAGRLFKPFMYESPVELHGGAFHMRIVESEYGYKLGRDLPPRAKPYTREEVEDAVEAVHCCQELADSRFKSGLKVEPPSLIADNAIGTAFVIGPAIPNWRAADLANQPVRLFVDGKETATGSGKEAGGHPVLPLVWLANDRSKRGDGLKRGMFVTTSSATGVVPVPSPSVALSDFGPWGKVETRFTA
jgi:2-keto-4-pentenoate hydratase